MRDLIITKVKEIIVEYFEKEAIEKLRYKDRAYYHNDGFILHKITRDINVYDLLEDIFQHDEVVVSVESHIDFWVNDAGVEYFEEEL